MKNSNLTLLIFCGCFINCIKAPEKISATHTKEDITTVKGPATYYLDPEGNDQHSGISPATAWKTLSKINLVTFSPGDSILLKSGGVWSGTLRPRGSGSAALMIVIDKYGGDTKPVIHGGGKINGSSTLLLDKCSYWEINNLEITNTVPNGVSYAATGIRVNGGGRSEDFCKNISIKNCYVHDVKSATAKQPNYIKGTGGIIISGKLNDVLVQGCHITHCSVEGLRTTGFSDMADRSKNIVFDNNLIENIYGDGIVMAQVSGGCRITNNTVYNACITNDINFAGIWTVGSVKTVVARNEVYGMKGGGPNDGMAFDADGWDTSSATDGDIFEYNYSHDNNGGFFLFMNHARNITVRYNVSVNDVGKTGAKKLFLIQNSSNTDRFVYNNMFYITNPVDKLFWEGSGAIFSNNIFYTESTIVRLSDRVPDNKAQFYNNCFYPANVFNQLNWGTALLRDNFYEDPLFVNPRSGTGFTVAQGYNIRAGSACCSSGKKINNNGGLDFSGMKLPDQSPDVGAFQSVMAVAGSALAKPGHGTDMVLPFK